MRDEVAAIARGLRAELRRRGLRGARTAAPAPREPGAGAVPHPEPEAPLAPRAAAGATAAPTPRSQASTAPPASAAPGTSGAPGTPEAIRARAQACATLEELRTAVAACTACPLHATRTQTVFQDGDGSARVMFVGEAPGADEDAQGVPFVGRAGRLLTDIIGKGMGLERSQTAIGNVLKCRPPGNRDPEAAEKALCTPWLDRQIELVDPEVLIPLGRHAANHLLGTSDSMGRLRGRILRRAGRKVVPTYHPAYLLRSPGMKGDCWQDIQLAMGELGLQVPGTGNPGGGTG